MPVSRLFIPIIRPIIGTDTTTISFPRQIFRLEVRKLNLYVRDDPVLNAVRADLV